MDAARVRAELEAMLHSEHFARSHRLSHLLRFLVEETLAGRAQELKETSVGVSVFDRPPDYDPKEDAIVRVEARRLRLRLMEYYAAHPETTLRIHLPKGSYVPDFEELTPAPHVAPAPATHPESAASPSHSHGPKRRWAAAAAVALLAAVGIAAVYQFRKSAPAEEQLLANARPFTNLPGYVSRPSFSPTGHALAFEWGGPDRANLDIYLQRGPGDSPVRISTDPLPETSAVWSPDGGQIAYLRCGKEDSAIVLHTTPGSEERVFARVAITINDRPRLDWSPDGKLFAVTELRKGNPQRIVLISTESGEKRDLTNPPTGTSGDSEATFSPDGKWVAFRRTLRSGVENVHVVPVEGGEPRAVTHDNRAVSALTWDATGANVLVACQRESSARQLWRFPVNGGEPTRLTPATLQPTYPVVSRQGDRIAFVEAYEDRNIYALNVWDEQEPVRIADALTRDCDPALFPDGKTLVFRSDRSGTDELWVQDLPNGRARRLTDWRGRVVGSAAVSPDATRVAFNASRAEDSYVYSISVSGGEPQRIGAADMRTASPAWSRDGKHLYVASNLSGAWEIWRMPPQGGKPEQVTKGGGSNAAESWDSRYLYYGRRGNPTGIYRLPLGGALPKEGKLVAELPQRFLGHWDVGKEHLFFVRPVPAGEATLSVIHLASGKVIRERRMPGFPAAYDGGLAVSPDEQQVYYTILERAGSNIMFGSAKP